MQEVLNIVFAIASLIIAVAIPVLLYERSKHDKAMEKITDTISSNRQLVDSEFKEVRKELVGFQRNYLKEFADVKDLINEYQGKVDTAIAVHNQGIDAIKEAIKEMRRSGS